jgi:TPR repeat protein
VAHKAVKASVQLIGSLAFTAGLLLAAPASVQAQASSAVCQGEECQAKIAKLKKLALNGSPQAQFILGTMYEFGEGVEVDTDIALRYYQMAIKNRNAKAMYQMSAILYDGRYGEQDLDEAQELLERAADHGLPVAMVDLAKQMLVDAPEAQADVIWELLTEAAERNNYEARYLASLLSLNKAFPHALPNDEIIEQLDFLARRDYRDAGEYLAQLQQKQNNEGQLASAETRRPSPADTQNVERISVTGQKISLEFLLDVAIDSIDAIGIYDGNSTVSRLPGRACTKWSNPPCRTSSPGILTGTAAGDAGAPADAGN